MRLKCSLKIADKKEAPARAYYGLFLILLRFCSHVSFISQVEALLVISQ